MYFFLTWFKFKWQRKLVLELKVVYPEVVSLFMSAAEQVMSFSWVEALP